MPPFTIKINSEQLVKGLRPFKRIPKDSGYLVESIGAVGRNGVLQTIDALPRINTEVIPDSFPYPQIFVFTNLIIVCSATKIYEFTSSGLVEKLTVTAGSTWTAVDFYEYVYLSNGNVAVVREAGTHTYSITATLPVTSSICNFNGQVLIGSPGVIITNTMIIPATVNLTITAFVPNIMPAIVIPGVASLIMSTFVPVIITGVIISIIPDTAVLIISSFIPIISTDTYKGYILGGYTTDNVAVIEDLIFSNETSQAITATLDTAKETGSGVNSSNKGYIMGGYTTDNVAVIEDLIFSNETSQAIAATLDTAKQMSAGVNSSTKGYITGGYTTVVVAVIEDLIFSNETSQTIAAALGNPFYRQTGVNSDTKGYTMGGIGEVTYVAVIGALIFSNETTYILSDSLDLSTASGAGVQSGIG